MLLIGGLKEGLTAHTQTKSLTVNHLEKTSAVNRSVDSDLYTLKPYIDIVDEIKASELNKMNFMD